MSLIIIDPYRFSGGGFSFNMTAGNQEDLVFGYSDGTFIPELGSIDAEPIPDSSLVALFSGFFASIGFHGDIVATVSGLTVWVDSVEYPFDGADWTYDSESNITEASWTSVAPTFVESSSYFVEIK